MKPCLLLRETDIIMLWICSNKSITSTKVFFVDGSEMKVTNTPFSYGVACYPEKHEEAPNIDMDIYWLKKKVEAGAEYAVTQLFYDNKSTLNS